MIMLMKIGMMMIMRTTAENGGADLIKILAERVEEEVLRDA